MPYALFDWDNTLHEGWTLEGWVIHLVRRGILTLEREPEWRALRHRYDTGRIGHNRLALEANRAYAREMAGRPAADMALEAEAFVATEDRHHVFPWAPGLLGRLAEDGIAPVIITGAAVELIDAHLRAMGLGSAGIDVFALTLAVDGEGRYTGRIRRNPGTARAKRRLAAQLAGVVEIGAGDSVSDLPLLHAARRQLIVGSGAPRLRQQFGASAATVESPRAATAAEVYALVR